MRRISKIIYPERGKIHSKYKQFIGWSFVSTVLVSAETSMVTHNMLGAINVPEKSETFRTFNYIGKDIIGQVGSLAYMSRMGKKADKNPQKFLLYSNMLQQTSYMLVSTTPFFITDFFLPIAGVSNILSNISFAGFGAINAKCIQTLSDKEENNIGEIYAKITLFNTLGGSIGLLLGLGITVLVPNNALRLCIIPVLGFLRIYTFNKAVEDLI